MARWASASDGPHAARPGLERRYLEDYSLAMGNRTGRRIAYGVCRARKLGYDALWLPAHLARRAGAEHYYPRVASVEEERGRGS